MRVNFGDFVMDSGARQLLHGGREVHLSPKAFDLLATLIAHRPAVVEKAALRDRLWPGTNVVDANLNNLASEIRSALGDDAQEPRFLRTAHGVGYAFCAVVTEEGGAAASAGAHAWLAWNERLIALDRPLMVIGRDPDCAIRIDAPGVSRRHASIRTAADNPATASIEDLSSTNGTFVNRKRIRAAVPITDGQTIQVGEATLTFRAPTAGDAPTKRIRRR